MRSIQVFIIAILVSACGQGSGDAERRPDSTNAKESKEDIPSAKVYSNARFRNVTVDTVSENRFVVKGEAQIFEANFGWVVEDGHRELKNGFEMTDAGAPAWGKFKFELDVEKERPNSTLTLILYESSAKDGSRQHELFIPLL